MASDLAGRNAISRWVCSVACVGEGAPWLPLACCCKLAEAGVAKHHTERRRSWNIANPFIRDFIRLVWAERAAGLAMGFSIPLIWSADNAATAGFAASLGALAF